LVKEISIYEGLIERSISGGKKKRKMKGRINK
jgi:hypothetical protein